MDIVQMPPKNGAEHTGEGRAAFKWSRGGCCGQALGLVAH